MNVLNNLSLAAAISVATVSAQAEMASIDDAVMSDITGQAGVTIEMSTALTIGQVAYKDEGSVLINTIAVGGGLNAGAVTGSMAQTQTIDVNANGDLVIAGSAGSIGLTVGSIQLQNSAANTTNTLIQDVYLAADLGASAITVYNGDLSLIAMDAAVGTTAAALVVANTNLGAANTNLGAANTNLGAANTALATATADQVTAQTNLDAEVNGANDPGTVATLTGIRNAADATLVTATTDQATATTDQATAATDQTTAAASQSIASTAAADAAAAQPSAAALAAGASGSVIEMSSAIKITDAGVTISLGSGSIGISGVTFDNDGGFATMSQKIWAQDDASGTRSAGLVVESGAIQGDLTVGAIELGGVSIGSVAVSDIDMAGSTMVIYGH